jgi:hypothetical protein
VTETEPTKGVMALHVLRVVLFLVGAVILGFSDFEDLGTSFYVGCAAIALGFAAPHLPRLFHRDR